MGILEKEEVDSDLGGFGGDLVGILEKNLVSDREWKERLERLARYACMHAASCKQHS